jgi:hypothetical protein
MVTNLMSLVVALILDQAQALGKLPKLEIIPA